MCVCVCESECVCEWVSVSGCTVDTHNGSDRGHLVSSLCYESFALAAARSPFFSAPPPPGGLFVPHQAAGSPPEATSNWRVEPGAALVEVMGRSESSSSSSGSLMVGLSIDFLSILRPPVP